VAALYRGCSLEGGVDVYVECIFSMQRMGFIMRQHEFQKGDLALLMQDIERDGVVFPAGTECVVIAMTEGGEYSVEVLEPRRDIISVPEAAIEALQP
jgi:c-di-GMP-binding flagellar brake protein YcgR